MPRRLVKGGWCPECEKEGKDPRHEYRTVLCNRHYRKELRERNKDKKPLSPRAAATFLLKERGGRSGWCPDCADEGLDPHHGRANILCGKHMYRKNHPGSKRKVKRGGWCPVCEQEGKDPKHPATTVMCTKHHLRTYPRKKKTRAELQRTKALQARGGRIGWCPECADEGLDPNHTRHTILCNRHFNLLHKQLAEEKKAKRVTNKERKGGWCPECEKEGSDPRHNRRSVLCTKHWHRQHRMTEEGRRKARSYRKHGQASPITVAVRSVNTEGEEDGRQPNQGGVQRTPG